MLLAERRVPRSTRVRVNSGYEPSLVHGRVGELVRIVFSREETASCSEHVVFPTLGVSVMLPPNQDVTVDLVPEEAGEYEFTCQLGLLRGVLVVTEAEKSTVAAPNRTRRERGRPMHYCAFLLLAILIVVLTIFALFL